MVKTTTFNGVNLPDIGMIDVNNQYKQLKHFGFDSFKARL
jgi:carboxynorspermidine decarboxylase